MSQLFPGGDLSPPVLAYVILERRLELIAFYAVSKAVISHRTQMPRQLNPMVLSQAVLTCGLLVSVRRLCRSANGGIINCGGKRHI